MKTQILATVVLASLISLSAHAAPVTLPQTVSPGFNGTEWDIVDSAETCAGPGMMFQDASITGHSDAYDDAWLVRINGVGVGTSGGPVDLTGTTITAGPVVRSGLNATLQHYFSTTSSVARIVLTMHNPTGSPITVGVDVPVNFGSDGGSIIRATSSGDTTITAADRWVVSSDGGPSDPINTSVFYGPGSPAVQPTSYGTTVHSCAGSEGVQANFSITIGAGQTRSLMFFAGLGGVTAANNTLESAYAAAALFNANTTLGPDWLNGMTNVQRSQVANWTLRIFTTCAAEGFTGAKLTMCRQVCEVSQPSSTLLSLIRLYRALFREDPPCAN